MSDDINEAFAKHRMWMLGGLISIVIAAGGFGFSLQSFLIHESDKYSHSIGLTRSEHEDIIDELAVLHDHIFRLEYLVEELRKDINEK